MDLNYGDYLKFLLALVFVLGLIGLVAVLLRRFGMTGAIRLGGRGGNRTRRLGIVEVAAIDARRRLVLVRRDDREHLVLLGLNNDLLVETDIPAPATPEADDETAGPATPKESFGRIIGAMRGERK